MRSSTTTCGTVCMPRAPTIPANRPSTCRACAGPQRLAAGMVEAAVIGEIRRLIGTPRLGRGRSPPCKPTGRTSTTRRSSPRSATSTGCGPRCFRPSRRAARVSVGEGGLAIDLRHDGVSSLAREMMAPQTPEAHDQRCQHRPRHHPAHHPAEVRPPQNPKFWALISRADPPSVSCSPVFMA